MPGSLTRSVTSNYFLSKRNASKNASAPASAPEPSSTVVQSATHRHRPHPQIQPPPRPPDPPRPPSPDALIHFGGRDAHPHLRPLRHYVSHLSEAPTPLRADPCAGTPAMPRRASQIPHRLAPYLALLACAAALPSTFLPPGGHPLPPTVPPRRPPPADGCLPPPPSRARICDPAGVLPPRARRRVLAAARALTRRGCGSVTVELARGRASPSSSSSSSSSSPSPAGAGACVVRVHAGGRHVLVRGRHLSVRVRVDVARQLQSSLALGSPVGVALEEALFALRPPPRALGAIPWGALCVVLACALWGVRRWRGRPNAARCRRMLKRLDDGRARARAARFGGGKCPICLEEFRGGRVRRRAGEAEGGASGSSGSSGGSGRRVLPCGHAFHEGCLVEWVTSQARNRAACPVCRMPARRVRVVAADCVSDNGTGRSGGRGGMVEDDSGDGEIYEEEEEEEIVVADEEGPTLMDAESSLLHRSESIGSIQDTSDVYTNLLFDAA